MIKFLNLILNKYFLSEYKRGFLFIFSSKSLIILITFVTTPIIARLYKPADYGLYALMSSVALVFSLISNLSLPTCLLVTDETKLARTVAGIIAFSVSMNLFLVVIGTSFAAVHQGTLFFGVFPITLTTVFLVTLQSLFLTLTQIFANLNIREKVFRNNVIVNLSDNASVRSSSLFLGFLGFTMYGMFVSDLIGKVINGLLQLYYKRTEFQRFFDYRLLTLRNIKEVIEWNKEYPTYNLSVLLVGSFISQIILWMLALVYSGPAVGYFTMAVGLLSIPLMLLSNSFQPLVTSKLFNELKDFSMDKFIKLSIRVFLLSISIYFLIYLLVPYFIEIYLGDNWLPSIDIIKILCLPFAIQLLGNSIGGAFIVFNKQRANFVIRFMSLTVLAIGFYFLLKNNSELKIVVIFYSIVLTLEESLKILYIMLRLKGCPR